MRFGLLIPILGLQALLLTTGLRTPLSTITLSMLSSALLLTSQGDFESMAKHLTEAGVDANAPAQLLGKSGARHEFAFAVLPQSGRARVVVDTALSVNEVDEMRVLAFYLKVYDVGPEMAVLAVSPKLNDRAKALAKEYRILVVENEAPRKLVQMVADTLEKIVHEPWKL